ncbi:FAD-dependent oxidoreductase [Streptomyces sp. NPDC050504]|uniref:FAD-dependent oxidoreductase n=1 Tax=Streptomyces sp. NPDC050504 TaxID=3365618 RepID=UPI00379ED0FE
MGTTGVRGAKHAIVVGGGFAGLVAARVLGDRFRSVTVLEQDPLTEHPAHRRGTPQSRHPHALLAAGAQVLEGLFPGLREELTARGAPVSDFGRFPMLYPTGWSPQVPTELVLQTFSRPLLEASLRRRVLAHRAVSLLDGAPVTGLLTDASRRRVTGVRTSAGVSYGADLVVVATGRHSKLPDWLRARGLAGPEVLSVDGRLSYASRLYRRSADHAPGWQASLQATLAPAADRGGTVLAIEDEQWLVCLFGAGGRLPPTDPEDFGAYAASLENPHIHEVTGAAEPLGPVYRYAGLGGQWRRYDRIRPWPPGLAVLGDALCSLNPLYGHGMTVAALQAELLGRTLDGDRTAGATARFQRRTARTLRLAWFMSTGLDRGWAGNGDGSALSSLSRHLLRGVLRRIPDDPGLYRAFLEVQHMLAPPTALLPPLLAPLSTSLPGPLRRRTRADGST